MAKDNVLKNVGDSIVIEVKPIANGDLKLTEFISYIEEQDGIVSELVEDGVMFYYRTIQDNIFITDWSILDANSIKDITIKQNQYLQLRLVRTKSSSNDYTFHNITFNGKFTAREVKAPTLNASIFSSVAWTDDTKNLEDNLFKKLYFRGIVPEYITRSENIDAQEDEDYILLFSTIAKYFAIIINFFKRFENIIGNFDLLREWVRQAGIQFDESETTLSELKYIANNLKNEIRKRGTKMIFHRQGDQLPSGKINEIDGEFVRLIRNKKEDELLYENIPTQNVGWCMRRCSPMYMGVNDDDIGLNKTKENTADFQNLDNFAHYGDVSLETFQGKRAVRIGSNSCLGRGNETVDVSNRMYVVDSGMDYEISFFFAVRATGGTLNFSIEGFDSLKNKLNDSFVSPDNGEVSESFLQNRALTNFITNKWYHARLIVHAYYSQNKDDIRLNIGVGNNLYFNNKFTKYILPKISIIGNGAVDIWNYKIRPLVRGTNIIPLKGKNINNTFSLGFIQAGTIFHAYFHNNNNSQSQAEITNIIEKYLLPYSATDILTFINEE